jgi:uncharacterized protein (DUF342 family)
MAASEHITSPSVVITSDKMSAQLVIPPGYPQAMLTAPLLKDIIRGQGVEVTDFTNQALQGLVESKPTCEESITIDIACAQPAIHGTNGSIQWLVEEESPDDVPPQDNGDAKTSPVNEAGSDDDQDAVSYYDRCAFMMVETGDVVGKILKATLGRDGRDVTGDTIPAKSGKDETLQINESLMCKADGSLVAQQNGVLYREIGKAQIRSQIEIKEYVDFSTGNIDFDGDISIGRGVRDCFTVKASGNVEVKGLIEAATIETGKDLIATGGFAGRERGHAFVGGSLRGKYLDNVHGHVKQDLCMDREVINCELTIDGGINSPRGSIIGGKIIPTGEITIGTLGSGAGVETHLIIGSVPRLDPFAEKLDAMVQIFAKDVEKLTEEQDLINKMSVKGRMTATDRERQTEIMFELSMSSANLEKAQLTLDSVNSEIDNRRSVSITVNRMVNPGVTLIFGQLRHKITTEFRGPARIYLENGDKLVYQRGDAPPAPLGQVADVQVIHPGKVAA